MPAIEIPARIRVLIYAIGGPAEALALFYGIGSEESWSLWIAFALSLVTGITAFLNRPTEAKVAAVENQAIAHFISDSLAEEDRPEVGPTPPGMTAWEED